MAIVTGGSSGIGRSISLAYAREGASVVILSRKSEPHEGGTPTHELIQSRGGRAEFLSADVSNAESAEHGVAEAIHRFGDLHVLTYSAGISGPFGDSRELDLDQFEWTFRVNVTGFLACARTALRHFAQLRRGRLIAVSSNFGNVGFAGMASYCASKGALNSLVRALAVEFGPMGITVNALCPGSTKTTMSAPFHAQKPVEAAFRAMTPLRLEGDGYQADPEDIAEAAVFMASDESRFMTGAEVTVDGGWSAW